MIGLNIKHFDFCLHPLAGDILRSDKSSLYRIKINFCYTLNPQFLQYDFGEVG